MPDFCGICCVVLLGMPVLEEPCIFNFDGNKLPSFPITPALGAASLDVGLLWELSSFGDAVLAVWKRTKWRKDDDLVFYVPFNIFFFVSDIKMMEGWHGKALCYEVQYNYELNSIFKGVYTHDLDSWSEDRSANHSATRMLQIQKDMETWQKYLSGYWIFLLS